MHQQGVKNKTHKYGTPGERNQEQVCCVNTEEREKLEKENILKGKHKLNIKKLVRKPK